MPHWGNTQHQTVTRPSSGLHRETLPTNPHGNFYKQQFFGTTARARSQPQSPRLPNGSPRLGVAAKVELEVRMEREIAAVMPPGQPIASHGPPSTREVPAVESEAALCSRLLLPHLGRPDATPELVDLCFAEVRRLLSASQPELEGLLGAMHLAVRLQRTASGQEPPGKSLDARGRGISLDASLDMHEEQQPPPSAAAPEPMRATSPVGGAAAPAPASCRFAIFAPACATPNCSSPQDSFVSKYLEAPPPPPPPPPAPSGAVASNRAVDRRPSVGPPGRMADKAKSLPANSGRRKSRAGANPRLSTGSREASRPATPPLLKTTEEVVEVDEATRELMEREADAASMVQRVRRGQVARRGMGEQRELAAKRQRARQAAIEIERAIRARNLRLKPKKTLRRVVAARCVQRGWQKLVEERLTDTLAANGITEPKAVEKLLYLRGQLIMLSTAEARAMLPMVLAMMEDSGSLAQHMAYLTQARELWAAQSPHERAEAIEGHVRRANAPERQHTARLVMGALTRDELLQQLNHVRDRCDAWELSEGELVQHFLSLQPQRLKGMGEAELLYALIELLPSESAARLLRHIALFTHLPPVRKQLHRPVVPYARAVPTQSGGVFGPTPPPGKPHLGATQRQSPREATLRAPRETTLVVTSGGGGGGAPIITPVGRAAADGTDAGGDARAAALAGSKPHAGSRFRHRASFWEPPPPDDDDDDDDDDSTGANESTQSTQPPQAWPTGKKLLNQHEPHEQPKHGEAGALVKVGSVQANIEWSGGAATVSLEMCA